MKSKLFLLSVVFLTSISHAFGWNLENGKTEGFSLKEGNYQYEIVTLLQGKEIKMTLDRVIRKEKDNWKITDTVSADGQKIVDEILYNGSDLSPIQRVFTKGTHSLHFTYNNKEITMNAMGKEFKVPYSGFMLPEGAGQSAILATLPLKEGFHTQYTSLSLRTQKMKKMSISFNKKEEIDGKSYITAIIINEENPNEMSTILIEEDNRIPYKMVKYSDQMGKVKTTSTLQTTK